MSTTKDSLFAGSFTSLSSAAATTPVNSPTISLSDARIAGALTDILLEGAGGFKIKTFDELSQQFEKAGLQEQFGSWVRRHENAYVSPEQVERVLGSDAIEYVVKRTGLERTDALERLKNVLPKVIGEATPFGGTPTERTFRYHLQALRRRLASIAA
jgi:uncharacterized protein YidB (DUF937 family)